MSVLGHCSYPCILFVMDNNFQTSFIPKKPLSEERIPVQRHTSIFSFITTLLFLGSLASAGGMYFYNASLSQSLASKDASLKAAQNAFEPGFIAELKVLDKRITNANELLQNHIVVTPIFEALQKNTLKSIQYTKFSYTTPVNSGSQVEVHMNGRARDYTSIALESDKLNEIKEIHDPIFSNLTLDERTGTVTFDLIFNVDANLVRYTNHLDAFSGISASAIESMTSTEDTESTEASSSEEQGLPIESNTNKTNTTR